MKYRGVEYTVVQGIERGIWKWSASVEGMVVTGKRANPTGGGDRSREGYRSGYRRKIANRAAHELNRFVRPYRLACVASCVALQWPHAQLCKATGKTDASHFEDGGISLTTCDRSSSCRCGR